MDKNAHNRLLVGALDCLVKVVIIVNWQQIRIPAVCNDEIVFLRDQLVYCPDLDFYLKKIKIIFKPSSQNPHNSASSSKSRSA